MFGFNKRAPSLLGFDPSVGSSELFQQLEIAQTYVIPCIRKVSYREQLDETMQLFLNLWLNLRRPSLKATPKRYLPSTFSFKLEIFN